MIGLKNDCSTLRKLSKLAYHDLKDYNISSSYKLNAISQACGRLSQMKQSVKRGIKTKSPCVKNAYAVNCYNFKINGMLLTIPYKKDQRINLLLKEYTAKVLSDPTLKVRSFTLNAFNTLSLSISKEIAEIGCVKTVGIDRNLRNVTVGNHDHVTFYNTSELLKIKENTTHVLSTFKRNDHRIRKKISKKLGSRRTRRINQALHCISKDIVQKAKANKSMIVFENLKGIRKLYRKGNWQGKKYRRKMNSWSFYELERQVVYKANWEGVPVKYIDPKCTSTQCPKCGKRIQVDMQRRRDLWCGNCKLWMDRDVIASMNIAYKGWLRFCHPQGVADEAMRGNLERDPVILRVYAMKLSQPKT